jgi:hypothetical protein
VVIWLAFASRHDGTALTSELGSTVHVHYYLLVLAISIIIILLRPSAAEDAALQLCRMNPRCLEDIEVHSDLNEMGLYGWYSRGGGVLCILLVRGRQ